MQNVLNFPTVASVKPKRSLVEKIQNFIKKYSDFLEVMNIKEKYLYDFGELLEEEEWIPPEEK